MILKAAALIQLSASRESLTAVIYYKASDPLPTTRMPVGWVKRDTNELHFCYPHFNDGAKTGDLVALGYEFDKTTRIVRQC